MKEAETKRIKYSHRPNKIKAATRRAGHLWPAAKFSIRVSCENLLARGVCVCTVGGGLVIAERATGFTSGLLLTEQTQ